ncbi:hypothetical protein A2954_02450 [Candidatus Roizmanbacteria bacterium RIFCSPLOWO2_01_FULL_37_12]|uniref:PIN domain-containing protein n=1 Tax=Candidatus Roizmanbacteria bacterium RIFCSPLOWO2_01_FULL_37_12 TaxID=1802056 RepID=A0A1F7IEU6_9BACT|nr:MAG: hypothetical protein A2954_02450 [Candidatus Roizmanbacteria bacterium RIFCSPLOWO2_01_FULL_37_12]
MTRLILDSSVYISIAHPKDIFHSKSRSFIVKLQKKFTDTEIIVPTQIILEVANILKKTSEEILSIFSGGQIIYFDLVLIEKIIPYFKQVSLKTSDAIIVACAKIYQTELVTWDKKLAREANKIVRVYLPDEIG